MVLLSLHIQAVIAVLGTLFDPLPFKGVLSELSLVNEVSRVVASVTIHHIVFELSLVIGPVDEYVDPSPVSFSFLEMTNVQRAIWSYVFIEAIREGLPVDRLFLKVVND
jgi:hypothetical protein